MSEQAKDNSGFTLAGVTPSLPLGHKRPPWPPALRSPRAPVSPSLLPWIPPDLPALLDLSTPTPPSAARPAGGNCLTVSFPGLWPHPLRKETNPPSSMGTPARGVAFSGGQLSDQGLPTLGHSAPDACRRMAGSRSSQKLLEMARAQEVLKPRRLWLTVSFRANPTGPETSRPEMLLSCCLLRSAGQAGGRNKTPLHCRFLLQSWTLRWGGPGRVLTRRCQDQGNEHHSTRSWAPPARGRRPMPPARAVGLPVAPPIPRLALRVWQGAGLRAGSQPHRGPRRSRSRP